MRAFNHKKDDYWRHPQQEERLTNPEEDVLRPMDDAENESRYPGRTFLIADHADQQTRPERGTDLAVSHKLRGK